MIASFRIDGWEHWLADVKQAGGAVVALVDHLPNDQLAGARGGFISTVY